MPRRGPTGTGTPMTGSVVWAATQIAAEIDDMAMMRLLAREGVGYAVVPPIVVQDELADGMLVEVAPIPRLVETFVAITPSRRFPNPLLRKLVTEARAH